MPAARLKMLVIKMMTMMMSLSLKSNKTRLSYLKMLSQHWMMIRLLICNVECYMLEQVSLSCLK